MGFAEDFIRGHQAGTQARAQREHSAREKERLALEAERYKLEAKRADAALKLHEMQANNAATQTAIQAAWMTNAPTIPVADEAGGVGPPAPAPRPSLPLQLAGGQTMQVEPQYADDRAIQARAAADVAASQKQDFENVAIPPELKGLSQKILGPGAAGLTSIDPKLLQAGSAAYAQDQANVRDRNTPPRAPVAVSTVDAAGNPVTRYMYPSQVVGREFPQKDPTTPAQGKAYIKALAELPEKVLRADTLVKTLETAKAAHSQLSAAGPIMGALTPDISAAAQTLQNARRVILTRNNPLKGQGQVSNFERQLSEGTIPNSSVDYAVAAPIYDRLIEEAHLAQQADQEQLDEARQWKAARGVTARPGAAAPKLGKDPLGLFQ